MKKAILISCIVVLASCGDSLVEECSNWQKHNDLDGKLLLNDDGINQKMCTVIRYSENEIANQKELNEHASKASKGQNTCKWSGHNDKDWLCIFDPAKEAAAKQIPEEAKHGNDIRPK